MLITVTHAISLQQLEFVLTGVARGYLRPHLQAVLLQCVRLGFSVVRSGWNFVAFTDAASPAGTGGS